MIAERFTFQIKPGECDNAVEFAKNGKKNVWPDIPLGYQMAGTNILSRHTRDLGHLDVPHSLRSTLVHRLPNDPERVFGFFRPDPIHHLIVFLLLSLIFCYGRFIQPHRTHIVAPQPNMPVTKLVLQIGMAIEDHQGTFTFQVPNEA
jgi:hypothetical protein